MFRLFHKLVLLDVPLRNFLIKMETLNETLWKVWMKGSDTWNSRMVYSGLCHTTEIGQ
jgi:hypothetical protein